MKITAFLIILLAVAILPPLQTLSTRSPELLGDAPAVIGRYGYLTIGVIWNDYAGFLLYSRGEQCYLVHLFGGQVGGADDPIPCFLSWKNNRFRGWIDFRGHPRPFCGSSTIERLPAACMWR